jgi:cytochrome d ubiquinol oxidase subunit I
MSHLLAGRAQMGTSLAFHIIFAALGMGLPVLMLMAHFVGLKRNDEVWMRVAERITRAFTVLVVIGVVSGIVISIELMILWPDFMSAAGPVIGLPISLETYAFFFEAIFLALYLFGRERMKPWLHWACLIPVSLGGLASAWIIVSVNSWMNTPRGFDYVNGEFRNPDLVKAVLNPSMPGETVHMIAAAYTATGLLCAGVYAFAMLRGRRSSYERRGLAVGMALAVFFIVPLGVAGDLAARLLHENQPTKLAAIEGLKKTQRYAPLTIGGIVGKDGGVKYGIEIPSGLSLLAGRKASTEIRGLDAVPKHNRPNVPVVRYAFQFMVGIGFLLGVLTLAYWYARWKRPHWLENKRWLLWGFVVSGPAAFACIEAGWIVTEVGRQPWIVYGYMRTSEAITSSGLVGLMFAAFTLLYIGLSVVTIVTLRSQMQILPKRARREQATH